jgi:hypothetical protein
MSDPKSNNKRHQGNRADDGADDERAPKRAKDEHVSASRAAAAIEEPLPLAESAALTVPLVAANVSVPTESAEAHALDATNLYAKRATRHLTRPHIACVRTEHSLEANLHSLLRGIDLHTRCPTFSTSVLQLK